ncbi:MULTISPECIES: hypothetical protein [unclassified Schlesneria]|uniref:hypothetical protein n=1 Tax=unclassified Schlesneria TaxID=2762017 RepID=UPI002EF7ECCD
MYFVLGAIVLFMGGDYVLKNYVDAPLEQRQSRKEQLEKKIKGKKKELAAAKEAAVKLATWEKASLPSDTEIARSLYRTWLLDLVEKSKFQSAHVDSGPATSRKGFYDSLAFSVRGKGTLHQLVNFLFDFYQAGHLHKIQSLNLTPMGKGGGVDISLAIDALVLPGAENKNQLSQVASNKLAYPQLSDYAIIAQRNLFGAGGESDVSRQAFLTAIAQDGEELEVWFTLRSEDKLVKLRRGSQFEIGHFTGSVVDILDDDVILESVGERWLLSIGESLAEATALPLEY